MMAFDLCRRDDCVSMAIFEEKRQPQVLVSQASLMYKEGDDYTGAAMSSVSYAATASSHHYHLKIAFRPAISSLLGVSAQ